MATSALAYDAEELVAEFLSLDGPFFQLMAIVVMPYDAEHYERMREKSEREDIVMFVNACFAATGQNEYYSDRYTDAVSIDFLHQYVLANYRTVYARALAAGINHFSQAFIIRNLLRAGAPKDAALRREEGQLIATALQRLPVHRVLKLFVKLRVDATNNRRTRAVVRDYLRFRQSKSFDIVKYRTKVRVAVLHAHAKVPVESAKFLFALKDAKQFDDPLFNSYLKARYSKQAIYELPYSVAEGLAVRHGIKREEFLRKIEPRMTRAEKLRLQNTAARMAKGQVKIEIDLAQTSLTRLAIYVLSLTRQEREERAAELHAALTAAAQRVASHSSLRLSKTAAVMDRSRSTWSSRERRRRPLAIAVAMHYLLAAVSDDFRSFWTPEHGDTSNQMDRSQAAFLVEAGGQTDLAGPLLDAIEWRPDKIILVSDGYENSPAGAVNQIVGAYRERLYAQHPISFLHANPVFDAEHFSPKRLGEWILTIGLRDAEDLPASIRFAKFAAGEASQMELESFLGDLAQSFINNHSFNP